jgi:hypothetical protein
MLSIFVTSPLFLFLVHSINYTLNLYETRDNVRSVATASRVHMCSDRTNINFVRPQIATCWKSLMQSVRRCIVLCCCVTCLITCISHTGCVVSTSQLSCERQNFTIAIISRAKSRNELISGSPYIFIAASAVRVVCFVLVW